MSIAQAELEALAGEVGRRLLARGEELAAAESCTGGWVAQAVTAVAGSSAWFDRGFVTYSNEAKHDFLGVKTQTLDTFGAVSKETALAMATGAVKKAKTDLAVSITGIAGPGGATPGKPVGLVHFAAAARDGRIIHREKRFGAVGRSAVPTWARAPIHCSSRSPPRR